MHIQENNVRNSLLRSMQALAGFAILLPAPGLAATTAQPSFQQPASPPQQAAPSPGPQARPAASAEVGRITEEEIRQQLLGRTLYLRDGYFDNVLQFDERGKLVGNSPRQSYTLSMIEINKVHLTRHKLELSGVRYGLHFLGAAPTEDPLQSSDKVRITPRKKVVKITIDREDSVASNKKGKPAKADAAKTGSARPNSVAQQPAASNNGQAQSAGDSAGSASEITSATPAEANKRLRYALDRVFAPGIDDRMIASLPDFWKLYYQAAAARTDYRPHDPSILRQSAVDQKARLLSTFEPPSNDFAQAAGVVGVALFHVVVGPDGKPTEIAVGRPIGFGLDENAVASIRNASFQPAIKDGKPVPVFLDLLVQFRIYSSKTAASNGSDAVKTAPDKQDSTLPGPYSAGQPAAKQP